MKKTQKILILFFILALFTGILIYSYKNKNDLKANNPPSNTENISYKDSQDNLEFSYPKSFGEILMKERNQNCPLEDTYRTPDTLSVYDKEISFGEIKLPDSQSFIRIGIREREINPENLNNCGDEFLYQVAKKEINPQTISSFKLEPFNNTWLSGWFNPSASRLNTEYRTQYSLFTERNSKVYVIQPYFSFNPYSQSKELKELEEKFNGNIREYVESGTTAENIRKYLNEFNKVAESIKINHEK